MNFDNGEIIINKEKIFRGYTFEMFKKNPFFDGQDESKIIYLKDKYLIDSNKYLVSFLFENNYLQIISLLCVDIDIPFEEEVKRKELHDGILHKLGLEEYAVFDWGEIESTYDPKGNVSHIHIMYKIS